MKPSQPPAWPHWVGECGCFIPEGQSYCREHNASLTCPIPGCEFVFKHIVADHSSECGCWYFGGGNLGLCDEHQKVSDAEWAAHEREMANAPKDEHGYPDLRAMLDRISASIRPAPKPEASKPNFRNARGAAPA